MKWLKFVGTSSLVAGLAFAAPAEDKSSSQQQATQAQSGKAAQSGKSSKNQGAQASGQQRMEPMDAMSPEVMKQARSAFSSITQAQVAIEGNQIDQARQHLNQAEKTLKTLSVSAPARQVVEKLGESLAQLHAEARDIDFAPLIAQVRQQAVYLDPQVVANVEEAEKAYKQGDSKQAEDTLRLAQQSLVADVALLPVESAHARVLAAQLLLQRNDPAAASRMLGGLPITVTEVQISSPLVPVRFNLRAAAAAAEAKEWKAAENLLDTAAAQLQQLERSADGEAARLIEPIADQAEKLQKQVDQGKQPKPQDLRNLAQRTRQLNLG